MRGQSQYQTVHDVDVWQTAGFKRVLLSSDVLANVTGLLIAVLGVARLSAHLPEDHSVHDVYLGPRRTAFHLFVAFPALLMTSLVPLLWLLCKPQSYFRHRTATIATVRLLRLLLQVLTLVTPSAAAPLARIVSARAWDQPQKGFRILLVMPMAFYMGHALYLLPWRSAALFQLASTSTVLHWLWRFPCFLLGEQQQRQQWGTADGTLSAASVFEGGSAAAAGRPWEVRAVLACNTMQSHAALLRTALGTPLSEFSRGVCSGASAIQAVQVFCTLICLLVIPVAVSHELERWMRLQYAQRSAPAGLDRDSSGASIASSSSSSSSSSMSASHASINDSWSGSGVVASTGGSINSLSVAELEQLAGSSLQAGSVCGMLLLAVFLLLPALWLLTEFLVEVFAANTDCATVLAAAA